MDCNSNCHSCAENDERNKNYERRLEIFKKEKDLVFDMYQESVRTIEGLKKQLECSEDIKKVAIFKDEVNQIQQDYSYAIELLEKKLAVIGSELELESQKVSQRELEITELKKQLDNCRESQESFTQLKNNEECLREKCHALETKCENFEKELQRVKSNPVLESELECLIKQLNAVQKQRDEVENVLQETQSTAEQLVSQENEARNKVFEAVTLVETTIVEKQKLETQLMICQNECKRLQNELISLIDESGNKVKAEVEIVKKNYQDDLDSIKSKMDFLEKDRNRKVLQIERQQCEIANLKEELEKMKRNCVSPRKIQALNEIIQATEAQLSNVVADNKKLNHVVQQNQMRFEAELKKHCVERRFLERQIKKLQNKLNETGCNLESAVDHCNQLSEDLCNISKQLVNERLQNENGNVELLEQLKVAKNQSTSAMKELKSIVCEHNNITSKLKDEYCNLTKKFNDRMKEMKVENRQEKRKYKKMIKQLTSPQSSSQFKTPDSANSCFAPIKSPKSGESGAQPHRYDKRGSYYDDNDLNKDGEKETNDFVYKL